MRDCTLEHRHACPYEGATEVRPRTPHRAFCPCHSAHFLAEDGVLRGVPRRIGFAGSLEVAFEILAEAERIVDPALAEFLHVSSFSNGREQGLTIQYVGPRSGTSTVAFAEHKTSDMIVVYAGEGAEFDFCTHLPSDRVFAEGAFLFDPEDVGGAAAFAIEYLHAGARADGEDPAE